MMGLVNFFKTERSMRPIALGRKNYLFMGSEGGGKSAAIAYTLIETAKLNVVEPQAWLTDVVSRIAEHKVTKLDELLPWRYAEDSAEQHHPSCGRAVTPNGYGERILRKLQRPFQGRATKR
jgi:hypothetical protein